MADNTKTEEGIHYASVSEVRAIEKEMTSEYGYSLDQLMELSGMSCAVAFSRAYPKESMPKKDHSLLVICGPGFNGGDGLVCARHLKIFIQNEKNPVFYTSTAFPSALTGHFNPFNPKLAFSTKTNSGYYPSIYYPKRPNRILFRNLIRQCQKYDIPFLSFLPDKELVYTAYNVIIDALFGLNFIPPLKSDFSSVMDVMKQSKIPIFSIDVPSCWDLEHGDSEGIQPDVLVSLAMPKTCSKFFKGRRHYLGGRFLPKEIDYRYGLKLPKFPGTDPVVEIGENATAAAPEAAPPEKSSCKTHN